MARTEENEKKFAEQYAVNKLNRRLSGILSSLGVTVGLLQDVEQQSGRVGVTDFSVAKRLASDSISMIRVANNMEGAEALSEEFSHLIIGAMRDNPLMVRNISALANEETLKNILGDDYQDTHDFYDGDLQLMAEEALGHILQSKLLEEVSASTIQDRLVNQVQRKFKNIKESDVANAINEADSSMSTLANSILSGNMNVTKRDIVNSQRDVQFNALSDRIDRNIEILKDAIATESKRYKISGGSEGTKKYTTSIISALEHNMKGDTSLGVLTYSKEALNSLRLASNQLNNINSSDASEKFKLLRGIKSTIQSYGKFVNQLNDLATDEENEEDFVKDFVVEDHNGNKEVINMKNTIKELNDQYKRIGRKYLKVAIPAFAEFLRPILGDQVTLELGNNADKKVSIEELLKSSEGDISFLDRWLDSMGNSSDILLRAFDKLYKDAMDKARLKSIKDFRRIQALQMEAESYGIKSYDWMFEKIGMEISLVII